MHRSLTTIVCAFVWIKSLLSQKHSNPISFIKIELNKRMVDDSRLNEGENEPKKKKLAIEHHKVIHLMFIAKFPGIFTQKREIVIKCCVHTVFYICMLGLLFGSDASIEFQIDRDSSQVFAPIFRYRYSACRHFTKVHISCCFCCYLLTVSKCLQYLSSI